jgi:hypothetical protein
MSIHDWPGVSLLAPISYNSCNGCTCSATSCLQEDGNLVLKHSDKTPYWDTKSGGKGVGPYRLELRDDCVVLIRDSNVGFWTSQQQV